MKKKEARKKPLLAQGGGKGGVKAPVDGKIRPSGEKRRGSVSR